MRIIAPDYCQHKPKKLESKNDLSNQTFKKQKTFQQSQRAKQDLTKKITDASSVEQILTAGMELLNVLNAQITRSLLPDPSQLTTVLTVI